MKLLLLLLIGLSLSLSVHAQFEAAFTRGYPERFVILDTTADRYFVMDSAAAFGAYAHLRELGLSHDDPKAVLVSEELAFTYRQKLSTYTLQDAKAEADSLSRKARKLDFPALEAAVYANLGFYCYWHGHYADCFTAQFKAYDIYASLRAEDFPDRAFILNALAEAYYRFGDYPHTIRYAREAFFNPKRQPALKLLNCNLLGMAWQKSKQYDSARYYFDLTCKEARRLNTQGQFFGWTGIALGNAGTCWYHEENYEQAIPLLKEAIDSTEAQGIWDNASGFLIRLCNIYLRQNNMAAAAGLIPAARMDTYRGGGEEDKFNLYKLLADFNKASGNAAQALVFRDSSIYWHDSLQRKLDRNLQTRAEMAYAEAKYDGDKKSLQSDLRMQRIVRNSLVVVLVLGCVITILLVRQRQQRAAAKERALVEEKSRAEAALKQAREQLDRFAENIHEKNAIIETLEQVRNAAPQSFAPDSSEALEKLRNSVILTEDGWEDFRKTFEAAYPGIIAGLKADFPACTAAEHRLMVLEKLQLSTKEMAGMLGVSVETIRSTRSRLKKKISAGLAEAAEQPGSKA